MRYVVLISLDALICVFEGFCLKWRFTDKKCVST